MCIRDSGGAGQLVGGLIVGKALLKVSLPGVVTGEGIAVGLLASGIELDEFFGHGFGGSPHLFAGLGPFPAAQAVELDVFRIAGGRIPGEQVQLGDRHIQGISCLLYTSRCV